MVVDSGILDDIIGHVRLSLLRDPSNLQFSYGNTAMRAIQMLVQSGAGLKLQHTPVLIQRPDSGECGIETLDDRLSATLQNSVYIVLLRKCRRNIRAQGSLARRDHRMREEVGPFL